jgi:hypothetical protein
MARILKFFSSTLQNFKIKYFHKDAQKYGYLTVGGTVCTCIRFCTQTDMFPLPPVRVRSAREEKVQILFGVSKLKICLRCKGKES